MEKSKAVVAWYLGGFSVIVILAVANLSWRAFLITIPNSTRFEPRLFTCRCCYLPPEVVLLGGRFG